MFIFQWLVEVGGAQGHWPVPDVHLLEVFDRGQDLARILVQRLLDLPGRDVQRLFPADRLPPGRKHA